MRVLLVAQHFPPDEGALATRWSWLSAGLLDRGHQLTVIVPWWRHRDDAGPPGVEVRRIRPLVAGLGLGARAANEALTSLQSLAVGLRIRADVVVATAPALSALPVGYALSRLKGVPLVLDLRDAWPELFDRAADWGTTGALEAEGGQARLGLVRRASLAAAATVFTRLRGRADAVVVTTESMGAWLRARGAHNVHVVRNTVPAAAAPPLGPSRGGRPDGLHVLYLGNIGRSQYLSTAVRAAAACRAAGVPVVLRLVGAGAHEHVLRSLAQRLDAPVEFHPRVPRAATAEHVGWADTLLVSLRNWPEFERTVPSKLYDALWSGRHISASLAGEAADIVTTTGAGDVVAPEDVEALASLWRDLVADPRRLDVGPGGRRWVEDHADRSVLASVMADVVEQAGRG